MSKAHVSIMTYFTLRGRFSLHLGFGEGWWEGVGGGGRRDCNEQLHWLCSCIIIIAYSEFSLQTQKKLF